MGQTSCILLGFECRTSGIWKKCDGIFPAWGMNENDDYSRKWRRHTDILISFSLSSHYHIIIILIFSFNSTVHSWRSTQTLPSMSTLLVPSEFMAVTTAVTAGISNSMAPSAALQGLSTVHSTWQPAGSTIFTVTATLKVTVITFTKERCEWDSGLESVLPRRVLTHTQAGFQCPESSLKRCQKLSNKHITRDQLDFSF